MQPTQMTVQQLRGYVINIGHIIDQVYGYNNSQTLSLQDINFWFRIGASYKIIQTVTPYPNAGSSAVQNNNGYAYTMMEKAYGVMYENELKRGKLLDQQTSAIFESLKAETNGTKKGKT